MSRIARTDDEYMQMALDEADAAAESADVPVGAVLVDENHVVLGRGCNRREKDQDPTAHAEIVALRAAAGERASWRLDGTTLYVTLEPCAMCAGALVNARIARVVYGCDDPKAGALRSLFSIGADRRLNHTFAITAGVRAEECSGRLSAFFAALRKQKSTERGSRED